MVSDTHNACSPASEENLINTLALSRNSSTCLLICVKVLWQIYLLHTFWHNKSSKVQQARRRCASNCLEKQYKFVVAKTKIYYESIVFNRPLYCYLKPDILLWYLIAINNKKMFSFNSSLCRILGVFQSKNCTDVFVTHCGTGIFPQCTLRSSTVNMFLY